MSIRLFQCCGGFLTLPDRAAVLLSRENGGNLVVHPPRPVWERSELTRDELMHFGFLVAAAGRAMLDTLPQLEGGCINYWEAGNWALNDAAEPVGPKTAPEFRRMHLHLLGRSRNSADPGWKWGESPVFPAFADRASYAAGYERLTREECVAIVAQTERLLIARYDRQHTDIMPWFPCERCGYPSATPAPGHCNECS